MITRCRPTATKWLRASTAATRSCCWPTTPWISMTCCYGPPTCWKNNIHGARKLRPPLRARAGGRIPGHQPGPVQLLLKHLASFHHNIFVVGDTDQSIYALARGRLPQRAALRERFPRRPGDPARAELPLHPAHPGRGHGGDRPQPAAHAQAACSPTAAQGRRSSCTKPTTTAQEAAFVVDTIASAGRAGNRQAPAILR